MNAARIPKLFTLILLLSLCACSKKDEGTSGPGFRRVSPALLPVPSCEDTSDDGGFEVWNQSEDSLMFSWGPRINPVTVFDSGYAEGIRLHTRRIPIGTPLLQWSAFIGAREPFILVFDLVDQTRGMIEATLYESFNQSDTAMSNIRHSFSSTFQTLAGLTPGCKRLYYSGQIGKFRASPLNNLTLRGVDTTQVLFRGHFDVEMY